MESIAALWNEYGNLKLRPQSTDRGPARRQIMALHHHVLRRSVSKHPALRFFLRHGSQPHVRYTSLPPLFCKLQSFLNGAHVRLRTPHLWPLLLPLIGIQRTQHTAHTACTTATDHSGKCGWM